MINEQPPFEDLLKAIQNLEKKVNVIQEEIAKSKSCPELRRLWTPRHEVMDYFGYANTQMTAIAKQYDFTVSDIGRKQFYRNDSMLNSIELNIRK